MKLINKLFFAFIDIFLIGNKIKKLHHDFYKFRSKYKVEIKKENVILFFKRMALTSSESLIENTKRDQNITVSLTSYGGRIDYVYLVIESLGMQTVKADRIVLWLSKDEFSPESIPIMLKRMEKRGLEIGYCNDIRSYKKIIPSLEKYPNDLILTVDDDVIYPEYLIEKLYRAYQKEPNVIHCHSGSKILLTESGRLQPYKKWDGNCYQSGKDLTIFPTGIGGVLYYPGCFSEEVTNKELFMELCPTADDVWLKTMSLTKGVHCKIINRTRSLFDDYTDISALEDTGLFGINKYKNDEQISKVFDYFNIWSLFQN